MRERDREVESSQRLTVSQPRQKLERGWERDIYCYTRTCHIQNPMQKLKLKHCGE
jgi:hypothetical protein